MERGIKNFIKNHKKEIIIGSVIVGGIVIFTVTRKKINLFGPGDSYEFFNTMEEAVEKVKELQKDYKLISLFIGEKDGAATYAVMDLVAK